MPSRRSEAQVFCTRWWPQLREAQPALHSTVHTEVRACRRHADDLMPEALTSKLVYGPEPLGHTRGNEAATPLPRTTPV